MNRPFLRIYPAHSCTSVHSGEGLRHVGLLYLTGGSSFAVLETQMLTRSVLALTVWIRMSSISASLCPQSAGIKGMRHHPSNELKFLQLNIAHFLDCFVSFLKMICCIQRFVGFCLNKRLKQEIPI